MTEHVREMTAAMIPTFFPPFGFCCLVSPRKSGKTFLIGHLLRSIGKRYSFATVLSKTSKLQGSFPYIDHHFNPNDEEQSIDDYIYSIMRMQKSRLANGQQVGECLIVCDDIMHSASSGAGRYSRALEELACCGRHMHISVILACQRYTSINPTLRSQATQWVSFAPRSIGERQMLTQAFLSREADLTPTESRKKARRIMDEIFVEPFRAMVICPDLQSTRLLPDVVTWIKAPADEKPWKMQYIIIADTSKNTTHDEAGPLSHLETI